MSEQTTMLRSKFTLWILDPTQPQKQYQDRQTPLATFANVKQFWQIFAYMKKPSKINQQSQYFIFREGIKPLWEQPENENGGYFKITMQKNKADKVYENAVISLITPVKDINQFINGVRMRIKGDNFMLQIWMNNKANDNIAELKQYMKQSLQINDDKAFGLLFPYKYKAKPRQQQKQPIKQAMKQTKQSFKQVYKERQIRHEWKNGGGTKQGHQSKNRSFNR